MKLTGTGRRTYRQDKVLGQADALTKSVSLAENSYNSVIFDNTLNKISTQTLISSFLYILVNDHSMIAPPMTDILGFYSCIFLIFVFIFNITLYQQ